MVKHKWLFFFLFFPVLRLSAMLIGNPSQPTLQTCGIIQSHPSWWSFRVCYLEDWVYRQRFRDEFKIDDICASSATFVKISTYAAQITLNFTNRIDFYSILGASRLQIDEEIFTKRRFAWGIGTKFVIFHEGKFRIGADIKYFETAQKPTFFVCDQLPYNVITDFRLKYHEIQGALGACYKIWHFVPYAHVTYIMSKIEPDPYIALVRLPQMDLAVDVVSKSVIAKKRWGMALGLTLVDQARATLAFEWRVFNQNAIDVNAEIRF